MEAKLLCEKRAVLVKFDGEIDHHTSKLIREMIEKKLKSTNAINVLFDFSNVQFMDSSGIGMIVGRYKSVKTLNGKVVVFGQNFQVKRIIELSGIDRIVECVDSLDEALKNI